MDRFLARSQRFDVVGSTNDVVRSWLDDDVPEVCLAIADEQTAGRGREDRSWVAPRGAALLLSLGFRPMWLAPEHVWRLAAVTSLAMADAAEAVAALQPGIVRLKWPNDLVIARSALGVRKLAGVLGETAGLGTRDPRAVVGIGINSDWPAAGFPADLAESMTSLRAEAHDRTIDRVALAAAFVERLKPAIGALRGGRFDAVAWRDRQVTTGREVRLIEAGGIERTVMALDVDADAGALVVADASAPDGRRIVTVGDVTHVRLASPVASGV